MRLRSLHKASALLFVAFVSLHIANHLASYWHFLRSRPTLGRALLASATGTGLIVSLLVTASLAGTFEPFHIPSEYRAPYGAR